MMKRTTFFYSLLLCLLAMGTSIHAQKVSQSEAMQRASQFFTHSSSANGATKKAPRKAPRLVTAESNDAFYIFNDEANSAFVIVSGEERTPEILGYSDQGTFDPQNVPENMRAWLKGYEEQIGLLRSDSRLRPAPRKSNDLNHIDPLLTSKWGQGKPYNGSCPLQNGGRCAAGCVPVAMAQLMYYWKYPSEVCTTISRDLGSGYSDYKSEIPAGTKIEWSQMLDSYDDSPTEQQKKAVADLIFYCGLAGGVGYSSSASGTAGGEFSFEALFKNFGYKSSPSLLNHTYVTNEEWQALIYTELLHKRPVVMSALSVAGSGHTFLCDGYDGEDFFHFNFGWKGEYNAYMRLDILNYQKSAETVSLTAAYNLGQIIVFGIQPEASSDIMDPYFFVRDIYPHNRSVDDPNVYTRSKASDNFSNVGIRLYNMWTGLLDESIPVTAIEQTIGLYKDNQLLGVVGKSVSVNLVNQGKPVTFTLSFGEGLSGDYELRALWRNTQTEPWKACAGKDFIAVSITDTKLTMTRGTAENAQGLVLLESDTEAPYKKYCELSATFRNDGRSFFHLPISVYIDDETKFVIVNPFINPGETVTTRFAFFSDKKGIRKATFMDAYKNVIGTAEIVVKENVTPDPDPQPEPLMPFANGTPYYIYNEAAGLYLCGDNMYDTQACLGEAGPDLIFEPFDIVAYAGGKQAAAVAIDTRFYNTQIDHYLGMVDDNVQAFLDQPSMKWLFVPQEDGSYLMSSDSEGHYLCYKEGTRVLGFTTDAADVHARWRVLTKEQMIAIAAGATHEAPANLSSLISYADFGRNGKMRYQVWQGDIARGGYQDNWCAEKFNCTFDVYQVLTDMPNGAYIVACQAFYREGADANWSPAPAVALRQSGQEHLYARLYANGQEQPVKSIFEGAGLFANLGTSTDFGYIPNSMSDAAVWFDYGINSPDRNYYHNTLNVNVTDGTLRLGIRKSDTVYRDWTCFDSFRLYYCGAEPWDGQTNGVADAGLSARSFDVYTMSGVKVLHHVSSLNGLPKGLYVVRSADGSMQGSRKVTVK